MSLKVDLYPDEVYLHAKGEVFAFPRGYAHISPIACTRTGHRCARVNGKLVPLRTLVRAATSSRS
jgi:(p)ppGpp synthase/HD superfamily hydrolase